MQWMKNIAVAVIVGLAVVFGASHVANAQTPDVYVYGVVRFPSTGPVVLDDANHTPIGVTDAAINSNGDLVITHTDLVNVGGFTSDSDESLTERGIFCGASQGFSTATLRCFDSKLNRALELDVATDYDRIEGTNANIVYSGWSSGH